MITKSLDQALAYVQSQNTTGVMHLVCKDGERKFMEELLVHDFKVQPPHTEFHLARLEVTLIVVGARRSISFRPDLPLWSLEDVRHGRYDTLQPVLKGQPSAAELIGRLTEQAEALLGYHGVRKIRALVQQYPPNVNPRGLITACKKLFAPLMDPSVIDELFAPYATAAPAPSTARPQSAPVAEDATFARAIEIFENVLGGKGAGKVHRIAEKYPPNTMPDEFTRACKSALSHTLGRSRATQLFERI